MTAFESFLNKFTKYGNFVTILIGISITGGGVWLLTDQAEIQEIGQEIRRNRGPHLIDEHLDELYDDVDDSEYVEKHLHEIYHHNFEYILLIVGSVTIVLGVLGFCAAKNETSCLIWYGINLKMNK